MSYTSILSVSPDSPPQVIKELRNSHGSAPVIWDVLCQKYLGAEPHSYSFHTEELWPLYEDMSISEYQRAVLIMTFDRAYISKKNFGRAASDIRKWLAEFPPKEGYVNHWQELADFYVGDPDYENIGLQITSTCEDLFVGEWNEELEDYDLLEWTETFEVYEELNGVKE